MRRTLVGWLMVSLAVGLLCCLLVEVGAEPERRIHLGGGAPQRRALVIGNSAYRVERLTNPVADAQAMATVLGELGFGVTLLTDATRRQMRQAVRHFREQLRGPDIGLFYFAGHGVQVAGENYLIPVGAELSREEDVEYEAVQAQWVLSALQGRGSGTSLMILDACRNNPFARSFRSATRGLATMRARGGALIAYATGPGVVAADGAGQHSPYTGALVRAPAATGGAHPGCIHGGEPERACGDGWAPRAVDSELAAGKFCVGRRSCSGRGVRVFGAGSIGRPGAGGVCGGAGDRHGSGLRGGDCGRAGQSVCAVGAGGDCAAACRRVVGWAECRGERAACGVGAVSPLGTAARAAQQHRHGVRAD